MKIKGYVETLEGDIFSVREQMQISIICPKPFWEDMQAIYDELSTIIHRFHFPCDGIPNAARLINGFLYSVSPVALKGSWRIFGGNKRWLTILQSERFGKIALIEVGACCVGSVRQTFVPESFVKKGDEKGYFLFGGSTVITLFEPDRIVLAEDLVDCTQKGLELYAHMGDAMAKGTAKS